MTVERFVELLQREYPQALVQIEISRAALARTWEPRKKRDLLCPFAIRTNGRTGTVHILCDRQDC